MSVTVSGPEDDRVGIGAQYLALQIEIGVVLLVFRRVVRGLGAQRRCQGHGQHGREAKNVLHA